MRTISKVTFVLFSSTMLLISPAKADDMLVNAMKRIAELEAKNIALEVNHSRLEQSYKELEASKNKLEQNLNNKEILLKKQVSKPVEKVAIKTDKTVTTSMVPAVLPAKKLEEITTLAFEGAYVGINGGYGGGDINTVTDTYYWSNSSNVRFSGPEVQENNAIIRAGGALAGGQFGYNYVFKNNFVVGAELDFDWTNMGGPANSSSVGFLPSKGAFFNSSSRTGLNWLSTERIKFGYLVGSFMPYLTGGLAIAQAAYGINGYSFTSDTSIYTSAVQGGTSKVGVGWSAGAGIEYSLLNNLSLKTEYLYTQTPGIVIHNSTELLFSNIAGKIGTFADGSTANFDFHQVRVGLNYHPHFFDNPAPAVIAKY